MTPTPTSPSRQEKTALVATALALVALTVFTLSRGAGGAPPVLVAIAAAVGLVAFVWWSQRKEARLRADLTARDAWGAPVNGVSPHIGRGIVLANQDGVAWLLKGHQPVIAAWDSVTLLRLTPHGTAGVRGFLRRFPPVPAVQLDLTVNGAATSLWLTTPGAKSLEHWAPQCAPVAGALGLGPLSGGHGLAISSSGSLEALLTQVGVPFLGIG